MRKVDEVTVFSDLIKLLSSTYSAVRADDVATIVNKELARFEDSRIREFVPLFVERRARAQLTQLEPALSYT